MIPLTRLQEVASITTGSTLFAATSLRVSPLYSGQDAEVLAFLAERPLHTVYMAGIIRDNGLVSPLNRGNFYACRNAEGKLEGVALIGHVTMVEARSEGAVQLLARQTQECESAYLIVGEQETVERFWSYFAPAGKEHSLRRVCRELLLELTWPVEVKEPVPSLRVATLDDLELIIPIHAEMAFEESGVNPLEVDPQGFRMRCARRVEQGRVWVLIESGQLTFKADIISDTPEVTYLEGIYVNQVARGQGYGLRCLSQLSRNLLERSGSICLLVNEQNRPAQNLYRRADFRFRGYYDTVYLQRRNQKG